MFYYNIDIINPTILTMIDKYNSNHKIVCKADS